MVAYAVERVAGALSQPVVDGRGVARRQSTVRVADYEQINCRVIQHLQRSFIHRLNAATNAFAHLPTGVGTQRHGDCPPNLLLFGVFFALAPVLFGSTDKELST